LVVGSVMLTSFSSLSWGLGTWMHNSRYAPLGAASLCALGLGIMAILWAERHESANVQVKLRQPKGDDGLALTHTVAELWRQFCGRSSRPPVIRWFPSMDVAAYAVHSPNGPELQISAGLWRAVISNNAIARAILAHEMAHLKNKDPVVLVWLARICVAARAMMLLTSTISLVTLTAVTVDLGSQAIHAGANGSTLALVALRIALAASSVLILIPLCWLALRRQVAFITSLIEIRADVAAAIWTGGLEKFTQSFVENENVRRSSKWNVLRSMLSPNMTHIPERERLQIVRNPAYIITPKIRFFACSLLLIFSLPLNFSTPLLLGGALNYVAMLGLSIAFNCTVVAMILLAIPASAQRIRFSTGRGLRLAAASCVITSLPCINLDPLSYLVMSWSVGFGGTPMDMQQLGADVLTTWHDLRNKFTGVVVNPLALVAVCGNYGALRFLAKFPAVTPSAFPLRLLILPLMLTCISTIFTGVDARLPLPPNLLDPVLSWYGEIGEGRTILHCLPLVSAAIAHFVQHLRWRADQKFAGVADS
jgi:Zn-dependent protease with chaperone function